MSYCRFGPESDVYLYASIHGGFECCGCLLARKVKTVFTSGCWIGAAIKHSEGGGSLDEFGKEHPYNKSGRCPFCHGAGCVKCWCNDCKGEGCQKCMMHDNSHFCTIDETVDHLHEHRRQGHKVLDRAFTRLEKDR